MKLIQLFTAVLAMLTIVLTAGSSQAKQDSTVRVATLNLMTTAVPYGFLFGAWDIRSDAIAAWSVNQQLDVLATQEGTEQMLFTLAKKSPSLQIIFRPRPSPSSDTEYTTLFYDPEKFLLVKDGEFWMSENPEVPNSKSWGTSAARRTVWAQLENKITGKTLFVFGVHFDHVSKEARKQSAKLVLEKINHIAGQNQLVLMGDFNVTAKEETLSFLNKELADTRMSSVSAPVGSLSTYIMLGRRLDYIYTDVGTRALSYQVQTVKTSTGTWASDHQSVVVDIEN